MLKRIAAMLLCLLFLTAAVPAYASEAAVYIADAAALAQAAADRVANVVLTGDMTVTSQITVQHAFTVDLAGHAITLSGAGPLFWVSGGGQLTITDSAPLRVMRTVQSGGTRVGNPASYAGGTLTWYETLSALQPDGIHTVETLYKCTSSTMGRIIAGDSGSRIVTVEGGSAFHLQGGALYGAQDTAVMLYGSRMTMSGGYLLGNTAPRGGAVYASVSPVAITGGVISGNTATGVSAGEWGDHFGGGALYLTGLAAHGDTTCTMTGGLITNNTATSDNYFDGGGAVLADQDAVFHLKAGGDGFDALPQLTANCAAGGGAVRTGWQQPATFIMDDGVIAANVARANEGGGVSVNMQGLGRINRGYVTNNTTNTDNHWGGGGMFCSDGGVLLLKSSLVTQNTAGGFGGGMAGCSTGRIDLVGMQQTGSAVAVFGNSARGVNTSGDASTKSADHIYAQNSPVFMRCGYQDFFCALASHLTDSMLGGGNANWQGSGDGKPVVIPAGGTLLTAYVTGLTAHPTQAHCQQALDAILQQRGMIFTGNHSNTHGGALLCNGYMLFDKGEGYAATIGDQLILDGHKLLLDGVTLEQLPVPAGAYSFVVKDEQGNEVLTGENDADGTIAFFPMLPFTAAGTYVYTIEEIGGRTADGIAMESPLYRLTVTVGTVQDNVRGLFERTYYTVQRVTLEKQTQDGGFAQVFDVEPVSADNTPYHLNVFINNYRTYVAQLAVRKVWADPQDKHPASVRVQLRQRGALLDTRELNDQNDWSHLWTGLNFENGAYTVTEVTPNGYRCTTEVTSAPVGLDEKYWVPATSLVEGRQYMLVSPDGAQALYVQKGIEDNHLTTASKQAVTPGSDTLTVGGVSYTDWYPAADTDARCIFTPKAYGNGLKLQNVGSGEYLLVQRQDESLLKMCNSDYYASYFDYAGGLLQGRYEWEPTNEPHSIVYAADRFNASTGTDGAVRLYTLVNAPITSAVEFTLTNTRIPNSAPPTTGDATPLELLLTLPILALTATAYLLISNKPKQAGGDPLHPTPRP